ncbi:carboxypeptidase-like regulatory domain-containing protein [Maribacter sp. SA7]|uniref:carboxypeptidase-like regulatory domain-containing protein n=1 Tax=Maribacter zhoushanensis TaxID=3030012 RepID=UPI0023EC846C|nr:carboxypeptidase-like regulatory domain-containing protein [Maribacter zhoushanensis]MDF4204082.1 carboxypeptidase-like regulatory domain-containing protein [Maribacter zhoushanensis]
MILINKLHKKYFLFLVLCISSIGLFAQHQYKGTVLDADTKETLPFVNIGIVNKGVGTVSDFDGKFYLEIDKGNFSKDDILQFSSVGYKTVKFKISEVNFSNALFQKVVMQPEAMQLNEAIVTAKYLKGKKDDVVGFSYPSKNKFGYWKGDGSLGAELLTRISVDKKKHYLKDFHFYVNENYSDSVLVRINIYKGGTIYPEDKLLKKNVTKMIGKSPGKITVDLKPYNLIVDEDFSIGLELLEVYGKRVGLVLAADYRPSTSYRRYVSQGQWKTFRGDAMTFYVNTTALNDGDIAQISDYSRNKLLKNSFQTPIINTNPIKTHRSITGFVFNNGKPVENATVQITESLKQTQTDAYGRYSIMARLGDVISYNYLGFEKVERKVTETVHNINVSMNVKVEELTGVTVTERARLKKTEAEMFSEYLTNDEFAKTAYGTLDKKTIGHSITILEGKSLNLTAPNILAAIDGKIAGVRVGNVKVENPCFGCSFTKVAVFIRGGSGSINNLRPAIFEVDGIIYEEVPYFLDLNVIERIAVIPGLAGVGRYGQVAAGGVIAISTHFSNFAGKDGKNIDQALIQRNIYKHDAIDKQQANKNLPGYLQALLAGSSFEAAKKVYHENEKLYSSSASFFLDAYIYFTANWEQEKFNNDIIANHQSLFENNINEMKALAYAHQREGEFEKAKKLYTNVFVKRPNYAQSYRDMANSYVEVNEVQKAANLYSRYTKLLNDSFLVADTIGLHPIITTEFNHFLQHKTDFAISSEDLKEIVAMRKGTDTRLLFEWNDDEAEFELQFVNPENRYFVSRTSLNNQNEYFGKQEYSSSKEFFLESDIIGEWVVNINYKGNKSGLPTYLKVTSFSGYGTDSEESTIRIYRLSLKNVNQNLFYLPTLGIDKLN